MTDPRLLLSALLLPASVALSACAADEEDPELDVAAVDRGWVSVYAPGPSGSSEYSLPDYRGILLLHNYYFESANHGHTQFRIYTGNGGVWTDALVQTLCTDGNWVEAWNADFVSPSYWMFVDVDCPSPYSVSEAWVTVHLDY
jgi:hypothetical protein